MGQSIPKQPIHHPILSSSQQIKPQKCILVQNPQSLLIVLSNGNMQNVIINNHQGEINLNMLVEPGLYFSQKNRVYLVVEAQNLCSQLLVQTVHGYYLASLNKEPLLIEPDKLYLIKQQQKYILIIESKVLGEQHYKFVDLKDLGRKMKKKQICWQDMEFSELILRFCRKYSKIAGRKEQKISNIIIGSDGSVHLLGMFTGVAQPNQKIIQNFQNILLSSLYGHEITDKLTINDLQASCQFKHPLSLQHIQNIQAKIEEEAQNKYQNLVNPHLKFIRDYITAYYYRLESNSEKLVDISMALKQWRKAKELLSSYMAANNSLTIISEENYLLYHKLYKIQSIKDKNSSEVIQNMVRISAAASYLALKFKQKNQYIKSFKYYHQCLKFSRSKLDEQFYVGMVEVSKALYLNNQTQSILIEALALYPQSRILNLVLIIHLCDCMRVDEAEKFLKKVTSDFSTLQLQLCSAKILLTKAILVPSQKMKYVQQSRDLLSNIVLQRNMKKSNTITKSQVYTAPLFHEIMGDSYLQQRQFVRAREQYQLSKRVLKNEKGCGFRVASMIAAGANCFLMQGKFDQSIMLYSQAMTYLGQDCKNLMDSIVGNRAIAKIKKGVKEEGARQIEQIMSQTPHQIVERDYNYIFLKNFLNASRNS